MQLSSSYCLNRLGFEGLAWGSFSVTLKFPKNCVKHRTTGPNWWSCVSEPVVEGPVSVGRIVGSGTASLQRVHSGQHENPSRPGSPEIMSFNTLHTKDPFTPNATWKWTKNKPMNTESAANICQDDKVNSCQNNRWSWMTAKLTPTRMDTWMVPRCMPDKFLVIVLGTITAVFCLFYTHTDNQLHKCSLSEHKRLLWKRKKYFQPQSFKW